MRPKGMGHEGRAKVRRLPLSADAAGLSFGQFLQLCFTADSFELSGRCLHQVCVCVGGKGLGGTR